MLFFSGFSLSTVTLSRVGGIFDKRDLRQPVIK
jgi:hypothetical protein